MLKHILIIIILSSLTACGFHLYGKNNLPPQMHTVYLQSKTPYGTLEANLRRSLTAVGADVVAEANQSPVTLNIISANLTHSDSNTVSSAQATVYDFNYNVAFNILDAHGKPITDPQQVQASRTLTLNPNEVLDGNPEVDTIQQEMERELAFKIINILGAPNTREVLKRHEITARTARTKFKK